MDFNAKFCVRIYSTISSVLERRPNKSTDFFECLALWLPLVKLDHSQIRLVADNKISYLLLSFPRDKSGMVKLLSERVFTGRER